MTHPLDLKAARAVAPGSPPVGIMEARRLLAAPDYEVTDTGKVYSIGTKWRGHEHREMIQKINKDGYPFVRLTVNGKRRPIPVHTLVVTAFRGPKPSASHQTRHLNGIKTDNRLDNLEWGTPKENAKDREDHGNTPRGERNGLRKRPELGSGARLTRDQAEEIKRLGREGYATTVLAKMFSVTVSHVNQIKRGAKWK